jgi:hypothetical protein
VRGERHDRRFRHIGVLADGARGFEAGEHGHAHVHQHDVGLQRERLLDGLLAVGGGEDRIAATLEAPAKPTVSLRFTRERAIVLLVRAQERVRALRDEEGVPTEAELAAAAADFARWRRAVFAAKNDAIEAGELASAARGMRRTGVVLNAVVAFKAERRPPPKPTVEEPTVEDDWW